MIAIGMVVSGISCGYAADKTTDQKPVSQKKSTAEDTAKNVEATAPKSAVSAGTAAQPVVPVKATGVVTGCDVKKSRLTVRVNPTVSLVFVIDKTTFLKSRGKNIKLADINKGDTVVVGFAPGKGDRTAIFVVVPAKPILSTNAPAGQKKK